jgi:hypothetical protein
MTNYEGAIENDESVEIGDGYLDCIGRKVVTCDFRSRYIFVMDARFLAMRFRPRIINRHQTVDNQGECMNVPDPMKFNSLAKCSSPLSPFSSHAK